MTAKYPAPRTRNVGAMASAGVSPRFSSSAEVSGEAMSAPPPKPMMAMPVAMPGRSGNHLMRVETGEM
ncbi:hypothetical protein GCM10007147_20310 [Nocardiopsis kunsanensis]|uniref:Uncharacterized protein n=1 Tax=Nocardiopsis kunsanensis TaxID=141693 RepID=A0A918XBL9_9ACTN|nr:hypothetical protein GCM10007147_20310 [Nocardiopsis kunsanensis]